MKPRYESVVDALEQRGRQDPAGILCIYLPDGEGREQVLTFGGLLQRAQALSGAIAELTRAGDRVVIMMPPGIDFFPVFWACLHAGTVPCVAYPPARFSKSDFAPVVAMSRDSQSSLVITNAAIQQRLLDLESSDAPVEGLPPVHAFETLEAQGRGGRRRDSEVAYLQYTSGSTSSPKGVRVMHAGLVDHLEHMSRHFKFDSDSIGVWWLPVHHSFGLVAGVILPVYIAHRVVSMSPAHFLERPLRWLEAIDRYRASHSGGPNFAYDLASTRLAAGEAKRPLDLSCWRMAGCGSEAVQPRTLDRFQTELAKVGMPATTLAPSYGLSEATLTVSSSPFQQATVLTVDGEALQRGEVVPCDKAAHGARPIVGVGKLLPGFEMKLVDPDTATLCPPHIIGEVWLRGRAIADGYWGRPDESAAVFQGRLAGSDETYLRTGDLGFQWNDQLFITGRCKELIIVRGMNFFPVDLEATVRGADPALANTPVAAFPWTGAGGDNLGVAVELDAPTLQIVNRIRTGLAAEHGIECGFLTVVPPMTLPRTGSGKLQRLQIARLAQTGALADMQGVSRTAQTGAPASTWGIDAVREILAELNVAVEGTLSYASRLDTLALSSLSIVRFTAEAQLKYGKRVPLELMLAPGSTVADLLSAERSIAPELDYHRDVVLPEDFTTALSKARAEAARTPPASSARDILLTGATGYLGANILQLLVSDAKERTVHCLVRARSDEEGLMRLRERVAALTGGELPSTARIRIVCGDVSERNLGLSSPQYKALGRSVSTVVHAAAHVNFVYPYASLRKANVGGTQAVLQFCVEGAVKTLHFLSTIGVLTTGNVGGPPRAEVEAIEADARLLAGYEQSKWVADRIVGLARQAGLAAWSYRVGFVGGRSDDGSLLRGNEFFPSFLRGCVELGVYPSMTSPVGAVPVDWVAKVISHQVLHGEGTPTDLHLVHPEPLTFAGCFERLREQGYALRPLPFDEWKRQLFATPLDELRRTALFEYLQFLEPVHAGHLQLPAIEFSASRRVWAEHPCRGALHLFDTCIQQLQASGELRVVSQDAVPMRA